MKRTENKIYFWKDVYFLNQISKQIYSRLLKQPVRIQGPVCLIPLAVPSPTTAAKKMWNLVLSLSFLGSCRNMMDSEREPATSVVSVIFLSGKVFVTSGIPLTYSYILCIFICSFGLFFRHFPANTATLWSALWFGWKVQYEQSLTDWSKWWWEVKFSSLKPSYSCECWVLSLGSFMS